MIEKSRASPETRPALARSRPAGHRAAKTPRGRPRKDALGREADQQALVAAAIGIMREAGAAALTARAVAARAGTAVGSVYAAFPNLEALRLEVNTATMGLLRDALAAALAQSTERTARRTGCSAWPTPTWALRTPTPPCGRHCSSRARCRPRPPWPSDRRPVRAAGRRAARGRVRRARRAGPRPRALGRRPRHRVPGRPRQPRARAARRGCGAGPHARDSDRGRHPATIFGAAGCCHLITAGLGRADLTMLST